MKRLVLLLMICCSFFAYSETPKVLLFIRDGSPKLDFMLKNEAGKMKEILEKSGCNVTIATFSGKIIKTDSTTLKPDIKLSKVKINDYAGFIFPCMAAGDSIQPEVIDFAKKVFEKGKPMAAQLGSVVILAKAGALKGKKYGFADPDIWNSSIYPELSESIQNGSGVVQDGNIITSGICPWMAKQKNLPDGTTELTQKLILAMNVK